MADDKHLPASKQVTLSGHTFQIEGISATDAYWQGLQNDYEPEFQSFCRQFIQSDYVCLDIGANIGVKTLFLSRHCPEGQVVSLEAGSRVAASLAHNIAGNGCNNAISYHAAAAGHDGTLTFEEVSAWGHQGKNGANVEAVTLETLVSRSNLNRVDFIKLDVEGGEFPVLRSSLDLIKRFETIVHVELNSLTLLLWGNTNPLEFVQWIGDNFSEVYVLNHHVSNKPLLTRVETTDECRGILRRNLVNDGFVTDLVFSNASRRFKPTPEHFESQISELLGKVTAREVEVGALQSHNFLLASRLSDAEALRAQLAATAHFPLEIAELKHQATYASEELAALRSSRTQDEQQIVSLKAELSAIRSKARLLDAERAALLASTSWRVSAPVRWVKKAAVRKRAQPVATPGA
ncbi:FkbM family methyltransferase [Lichenicoccus sp.]|uniref:FkbM family methyltransferase n=1 Tax=Lichenicoccus sp. TaxID=2781899 RepID=UPI003D0A1D6F